MISRTTLYAASALAVALAGSGCEQRASTASGSPTATAQAYSPGAFEALDVDHDGGIAMWEAQADPSLAARFGALDRNGDGKLDRTEYSAGSRGDLKAAGG
jgi:EF hand